MPDRIWVVDDDRSIRWVLERALNKAGFVTGVFENAQELLLELQTRQPDVIISDIRMPDMDGFELLSSVRKYHDEIPVIIMTAHSDMDSAVSAYEKGAFEYLPKPFDINDAIELTRRACESISIDKDAGEVLIDETTRSEIIGQSTAMQELFRTIGRLSKTSISVLITGESGTGKELVAKALHVHSPRSSAAFVSVNVAAIPEDLLESELFGHEQGVFPGANDACKGRFEQAAGGALFLDEIGGIPADIQSRLLRFLSDGTFYRSGGHQSIKVDVRVIAATHQDLEKQVAEGKFREDLYHRLNVINVKIPPLRERRDDIPLLFRHFLKSAALELDVELKNYQDGLLEFLQSLDWPGNVRQLENVSRWLMVMSAGNEISMDDLPQDLRPGQSMDQMDNIQWQNLLHQHIQHLLDQGRSRVLDEITPIVESLALDAALKKTRGRKKAAADLIGWGRNTLTRKLKELDIDL